MHMHTGHAFRTLAGAALLLGAFAAPSATANSGEMTDVPAFAILYKHAPETVSRDAIRSKLSEIISRENAKYAAIKQSEAHDQSSSYDHDDFLFTEEEIFGRNLDFAVEELLPRYEPLLQWQANAVPRHLTMTRFAGTGYFRYENGVLNSNTSSGQGSDVFYRFSVESEQRVRRYPTLGARALMMGAPPLQARMDTTFFDRLPSVRMPRIALDRLPTLAPIPISRADAEAVLSPPEQCVPPSPAITFGSQGESVRAERQARRDEYYACIERARQIGRGFEIRFDVTVEGLVEKTDILSLRLRRIEVFSPRGDLLKTFLPSDLETPTDHVAAREAEQRARQAEAERQRRAEQAERDDKRDALASADILGIDLSMTVAEAEAVVRRHFEVARVRERSSERSSSKYFQDIRQLENADGSDRVVLYSASPGSDVLVAVGRVLRLPEGATWADVGGQILAKFGEPTEGSDKRGYEWYGFEDRKLCRPGVGPGRAPRVVEGERLGHERYNSVKISNVYSTPRGDALNEHYGRMKDQCSTFVYARVHGASLYMAIVDTGKFASANFSDRVEPVGVKLKL